MVEDPGLRKGFVWGQIYIVLSIVLGIVGIIWSIMAFVGTGSMEGVPEGEITIAAIITLIISALFVLGGVGLYGRWKWGLYLTYFLLLLMIASAIWQVIAFFVMGGGELTTGIIVARIIAFCVHVLIFSLFLGYFIRRRSWFH